MNKDNKCSRPIIVHRSVNHEKLPKQFVLSVVRVLTEPGERDIVLNTELNLYAEYNPGFLDNIIKGFRKATDNGYCIIVEETKDTLAPCSKS